MDEKTAESKIRSILENFAYKTANGEYASFKEMRRHIVNIQMKTKYSHSGPDWWEQAAKLRTVK